MFTHMIFYVEDVQAVLDFYRAAFDIQPRFIHESGEYAELDTGATSLSFASLRLAAENVPDEVGPAHGCEVCLTVTDPDAAYARAVETGAEGVVPPIEKPWGQRVGYVRDPAGTLIAISNSLQR
jgi:lactoylglutathione lyase